MARCARLRTWRAGGVRAFRTEINLDHRVLLPGDILSLSISFAQKEPASAGDFAKCSRGAFCSAPNLGDCLPDYQCFVAKQSQSVSLTRLNCKSSGLWERSKSPRGCVKVSRA